MEREEGEGKGEGRRRGGGEKMRGIIVGGMVLSLLMGCNNGLAELEKKNSFYESVVKIGQGFQEIFGNFGNAMGEALGFNAVKSGDPKSKVGEHFEKVGKGLKSTKEQLDGLVKEITSTSNADTKGVEGVISSASGVITKLIESVGKLAKVTKEGGSTNIGDNHTTKAVASSATDVEAIIKEVKAIVETATNSGIKTDEGKGKEGGAVSSGSANDAPAVLAKSNGAATSAGDKLASQVAQADPWAMIDKIKDANVAGSAQVNSSTTNGAGELATGTKAGDDAGAKTNADLAAAVALRAMTKTGQFNAPAGADAAAVKGAAVSAVNKVLGVLDEIIRRTVAKNLDNVREAVKGIKYSETGEATEIKK